MQKLVLFIIAVIGGVAGLFVLASKYERESVQARSAMLLRQQARASRPPI